MSEQAQLRVPPPLPETRVDLLAKYRLKRRRSINDLVEELVIKLWDDKRFISLIEPIYDSQAIEGSIDDNYTMAALLIRDTAKKDKHEQVADQNLHTIKLAMRVALRRFTDVSQPERLEHSVPAAAPEPEPGPESETAEQTAAQ